MKKRQRTLIIVVLINFLFLETKAQTTFAIIYQDSIDVFTEQILLDSSEAYQSIVNNGNAYFKEVVNFYINKQQWAITRHDGGCLSPKEWNCMTRYLLFLEKELKMGDEKLNTLLNKIKENAQSILQDHMDEFLATTARQQGISVILNANQIYFEKKNMLDLTTLLIENLNQNKTILSQKMYLNQLSFPVLFKINREMRLVDYETFKEKYDVSKETELEK